jgi:tetratricopeptide (TPR) repeat protein
MRHRSLGLFLLLVAGGGLACASNPIKPAVQLELARADALVTEGCWDCLNEARLVYEKAAVLKARPLVLPRLFETTVLIGLRQKELSLDPAKTFETAKAIGAELPSTYGVAAYLEIANAILPDSEGTPARERAAFRRMSRQQYDDWKAILAGPAAVAPVAAPKGAPPKGPAPVGASDLFRNYLALSVDCDFIPAGGFSPPPPPAPARPPAAGTAPGAAVAPPPPRPVPTVPLATPIATWRAGNCVRMDRAKLTKLIEEHPRFVEAGVIVGRTRTMSPTGKEVADARTWLAAGLERWPASPVVTYAMGSLSQTVGDCKAAVTHYETTLVIKPGHERAHLGRLICLSYLRQHNPAIEQATTLIGSKSAEGESYYWRAWNKHQMNDLPAARADSDRMKQIYYTDLAMTLAGMIEYDQDDLDIAEKDLRDAVRLSAGKMCVPVWYLALVHLKRQKWQETADGFVLAKGCYERSAAENREYRDAMKLADVDEEFRKIQLASFEALIAEDESQISASAYNAATNYARAGRKLKALEYCDMAAKDPKRAAKAAELRALIEKMGGAKPGG